MVTLGKEPCEDCVNEAADDHDRDAGSKDGGQTNGNYERHAISTDREVSLSVRSYYYFSSSVALFQIFDSLRDLAQRVTPVDNRCHLSGLHEIAQEYQVIVI